MVELTTFELINGIMSIIFVSISIIVGVKIASKYIKYKRRTFLLFGITWIGVASIWYSHTASVIIILTTGHEISDELYMFLGNAFLPITWFVWMIAFTDLVYKDKQKILLILSAIYGIIFEIYFIYYLFTDSSVLGELVSPVDASYNLIMTFYQISCLIYFLTTGILFARPSLKSDNPEIKLKGKFLLIAFISLVMGAVFEILSHISIFILIIGRLILISSSIEFYCGFILPKRVEKIFLRQK
jgi:hypothetical protein